MKQPIARHFFQYLRDDLAIPAEFLAVAMRSPDALTLHQLPMILWQYGLVTLDQLDSMFEWLEAA